MSASIEQSYAYCRQVARNRARNFYYSFVLLPRPQHDAMCAVYAFMRYCDDLSDSPEAEASPRAALLEAIHRWRADLDRALAGDISSHPTWPALRDTVEKYRIPSRYLHEMIDGISSDLDPRQFRTFDELHHYCYQVASVVGLTIIHIFGYESPEAFPLAEECGIAFQLTNILRDVREDAERGRVYLPAEDLDRFGVRSEELRGRQRSQAFLALMQFEAARARQYYRNSQPLLGLVDARNRSSLWALIEIYSRLLSRIERSRFDVLERRVALPRWEKSWIVLRAALGRTP